MFPRGRSISYRPQAIFQRSCTFSMIELVAKDIHFEGVNFEINCLDSEKIASKMVNVPESDLAGWSFFCLDKSPPSDFRSYVFPNPKNEFERVIYLKEKLKKKYANIRASHPPAVMQ